MNLIRHLVAADLRRFGWLIAAWVTLVAAGVVVYAWLPLVAGSQRTSEALRMTSAASSGLQSRSTGSSSSR